MADSAEEKKIIIDEDWKSQVEAEKEQAEADREASDPGDPAATVKSANEKASQEIPLPPADFTTIVSMLATQAMLNLGTLPNPMTGKTDRNLPQAKHAIDLVEVLQEKTKGNCNPQEVAILQNLLHELRMAYVASEGQPADDVDKGSGNT
ncbi:MAG: hypothetical protein CMJ74_10455 [Planctomycetaceae bacterium]|nr:hypothetical protein [Planctomycetaceae bacterium]